LVGAGLYRTAQTVVIGVDPALYRP